MCLCFVKGVVWTQMGNVNECELSHSGLFGLSETGGGLVTQLLSLSVILGCHLGAGVFSKFLSDFCVVLSFAFFLWFLLRLLVPQSL